MALEKNHYRLLLIICGLTVVLAIPRFNHYVAPDSIHYLELAAYFAGNFAKAELQTPFAYRILVPFLASLGPDNTLDINMALISTFFTAAAFILFYFYLEQLFDSRLQINLGLLLLIIAFPTVNYASGVMTDAAGFFFFVLATYLFLKKRYIAFTGAWTLGVLARDALLSLSVAVVMVVFLQYWRGSNRNNQLKLLLTLLPPWFAVVAVRFYFTDLPSFLWTPSWRQFIFTVSRPVAWTTFLLTLLPPLTIFLLAYRKQPASSAGRWANWSFDVKAWLISLSVAGLALNLYSITSAALSGRFVWPFYVVLVPLAAAYFRDDGTLLFRTLAAAANKLFDVPPPKRELNS